MSLNSIYCTLLLQIIQFISDWFPSLQAANGFSSSQWKSPCGAWDLVVANLSQENWMLNITFKNWCREFSGTQIWMHNTWEYRYLHRCWAAGFKCYFRHSSLPKVPKSFSKCKQQEFFKPKMLNMVSERTAEYVLVCSTCMIFGPLINVDSYGLSTCSITSLKTLTLKAKSDKWKEGSLSTDKCFVKRFGSNVKYIPSGDGKQQHAKAQARGLRNRNFSGDGFDSSVERVKNCVIYYEVGLIQRFESLVVFSEPFQSGVSVWLLQSCFWRWL